MIETWKPIPGFEGLYEASTQGRVRSIDRLVTGRNQSNQSFTYFRKGKVLYGDKGKDGYCRTYLYKDGKWCTKLTHRLIAMTFIPNPENKPEVNHKDRNHSNNCVENLEWVTKLENMQHARASGWDPGVVNRGKQFSEEHKQKMSKALKGRIFSDATIRKFQTGHIHQQVPVKCLEDDIVFCSCTEASKYYNVDLSVMYEHSKTSKLIKSVNKTFVRINRDEYLKKTKMKGGVSS